MGDDMVWQDQVQLLFHEGQVHELGPGAAHPPVTVLPDEPLCGYALCAAPASAHQKCASCKTVSYCGSYHELLDGELMHRAECKLHHSRLSYGDVGPPQDSESLLVGLLHSASPAAALVCGFLDTASVKQLALASRGCYSACNAKLRAALTAMSARLVAKQACKSIRITLSSVWNPMGYADLPADEYDSYIPGIVAAIHEDRSEGNIQLALHAAEMDGWDGDCRSNRVFDAARLLARVVKGIDFADPVTLVAFGFQACEFGSYKLKQLGTVCFAEACMLRPESDTILQQMLSLALHHLREKKIPLSKGIHFPLDAVEAYCGTIGLLQSFQRLGV
jgi:hypothetical protein